VIEEPFAPLSTPASSVIPAHQGPYIGFRLPGRCGWLLASLGIGGHVHRSCCFHIPPVDYTLGRASPRLWQRWVVLRFAGWNQFLSVRHLHPLSGPSTTSVCTASTQPVRTLTCDLIRPSGESRVLSTRLLRATPACRTGVEQPPSRLHVPHGTPIPLPAYLRPPLPATRNRLSKVLLAPPCPRIWLLAVTSRSPAQSKSSYEPTFCFGAPDPPPMPSPDPRTGPDPTPHHFFASCANFLLILRLRTNAFVFRRSPVACLPCDSYAAISTQADMTP
jgi:hypothetical protein